MPETGDLIGSIVQSHELFANQKHIKEAHNFMLSRDSK